METAATFFKTFIRLYPDWQSLSQADIKVLEDALQPIGLYKQRASRLHALALEMVKRKGIIPSDKSELELLPFFGQYLINAVTLQIFKVPAPLLDVNMARVLERYFAPRKLADIRFDGFLQNLAAEVVSDPSSKETNWAILDFGALVCTARNPKCETCILAQKCTFFVLTKRQ